MSENLIKITCCLNIAFQGSNDDDDIDNAWLKGSIKQSISRQQFENFQSFCFAAKAGDLEIVRDLVRRGADINHPDYDGRTAFAMVLSAAKS